jgi:CHASE3 domain sensor protein
MNLKEKTREELEQMIAEKGIGSEQLKKAERMQRDLNLALIIGATATILGITAWTIYKYKYE